MRRRPGPLSYESKIVLLDVAEAIEELQQIAGRSGYLAQELTRMNMAGQHAHAQAWAQLYQALDDALRDLELMMPLFRLDRGVLFQIYNSMRRLKEHWRAQRIAWSGFSESEPDGLTPENRQALHDDEARLTRIVEYLKRLVAVAP